MEEHSSTLHCTLRADRTAYTLTAAQTACIARVENASMASSLRALSYTANLHLVTCALDTIQNEAGNMTAGMKGSSMAKHIMVINDTQEILELFRDILTDEGYEAILYAYAVQDIAEIERLMPDLIILDFMFGNDSVGWQLLQKLKMHRTTEKIPVVMCTAAAKAVQEIEGHLTAMGGWYCSQTVHD